MNLRERLHTLRQRLVLPVALRRLLPERLLAGRLSRTAGGEATESRWGGKAVPLRYVVGFVVLFGLFLALHLVALRLPSILRAQIARMPGVTCLFTEARLDLLPPGLVLTDVVLGGPALGNELVRVESIRISPSFWALVRGRLGGELALTAGQGHLTLDVERPLWGDTPDTEVTLVVDRLPLGMFSMVPRFDVQAQGAISAQGSATIQWQRTPSGALVPRACNGSIRGALRLASLRNGLQGLLMDRFTDAVLTFNSSMAGRVLTLTDLRFTAPEMDVSVSGRAVADWRSLRQSELNMVADIKTAPENVMPQLLTESLRQRLASGQTFSMAIQGTLFAPVFAPVL